ncbi:hypothetical protein DRN74_04430 [Candidatus Micrarchaeota archaeon]|nr:MAG: hypothetical protein DRN74_04430 [Candidatus Micrarchaeota archaeon]
MITYSFLQEILLSIFIGALLGMEREYHKKQEIMGLRTFALISLLGTMTVVIPEEVVSYASTLFTAIGLAFISIFAIVIYVNSLIRKKGPGFTTCISVIITYILGVMVGYDMFFEAIFLSIAVAVILFSRERLHQIVKHLTQKEVGDLLEFLILLGIVYPIIPRELVLYGIKLPLLLIWALIVLVSLINFIAFLSARFLRGSYQIEIISFLGGMMSSIAATMAVSNFYKENKKRLASILAAFFTINAGLSLRNLIIVAMPAPQVLDYAFLPFLLMISMFIFFAYYTLRKVMQRKKEIKPITVESPFNVKVAAKLGLGIFFLFVLLDLAGKVNFGVFLITAFVGGVISSTSTSISIAGLLSSGNIDALTATFALFLANAGSICFAWLLCYLNGTVEIIKYSAKQMFLTVVISLLSLFMAVGLMIH